MYIYIRKSCISIDHFGFGIALELKRIVGNLKGLYLQSFCYLANTIYAKNIMYIFLYHVKQFKRIDRY